MLIRLNQKAFRGVVGNRNIRSAVAFAIYLKDKTGCSVVKDWSYRKLSQLTGVSPNTCKKRIQALRELRVIREWEYRGHRYLRVLQLRARKVKSKRDPSRFWNCRRTRNIDLTKIDRTSVKTIERGLMAMLIVDIQTRKDSIHQLVCVARGLAPAKNENELNKTNKKCSRRGWLNYLDGGISYKGIARRLKCARKTVSAIISYGEKANMFVANRGELLFGEKLQEFCDNFLKDSPISVELRKRFIDSKTFEYCGRKFLLVPNTFSLVKEGSSPSLSTPSLHN